jgi:putative oxidoreductase
LIWGNALSVEVSVSVSRKQTLGRAPNNKSQGFVRNYKSEGYFVLRKLFQTDRDYVLTILRVVVGVVFLAHGAQKVLGWFGGYGFSASLNGMEHMGIPALFAFLAIVAEFFGGLGLIVGLLSRVAAFGIFVEMVVAIVNFHGANGLFMNWAGNQRGEGFEFHLLALALLLMVMVRGAGALSLDRLIANWPGRERAHHEKHSPAAA